LLIVDIKYPSRKLRIYDLPAPHSPTIPIMPCQFQENLIPCKIGRSSPSDTFCNTMRLAGFQVYVKPPPTFISAVFIIESICSIATCPRSEEHTSELQSRFDIVCRLLLAKKNCY